RPGRWHLAGHRTRRAPVRMTPRPRRAGAGRSGPQAARGDLHSWPPDPRRAPPRPSARPLSHRRRTAGAPLPAPARPPPEWCAAQAGAPSRQTAPRRTPQPASRSDELQQDHLAGVRAPRAELQDPGVAASALRIARRDLLKQLVHRELVLAQGREGLAPRVQITPLGQRDQLLDLRLDRLGLGLGGLDALVVDDLLGQPTQQGPPVRGGTAELVALALVTHRRAETLAISPRAATGRAPGASPRPRRSTSCRSSGSR